MSALTVITVVAVLPEIADITTTLTSTLFIALFYRLVTFDIKIKIGLLVDLICHYLSTDVRSVRKLMGIFLFLEVLILNDGGYLFSREILVDVLRRFLLTMFLK